jgi:hypothetical protein
MSKLLKEARLANVKKAQAKASSPAARKKAAATFKRNRAAKLDAEMRARNGLPASVPLDMIPDPPARKKWTRKVKPHDTTRQEVVLALLKYLNGG